MGRDCQFGLFPFVLSCAFDGFGCCVVSVGVVSGLSRLRFHSVLGGVGPVREYGLDVGPGSQPRSGIPGEWSVICKIELKSYDLVSVGSYGFLSPDPGIWRHFFGSRCVDAPKSKIPGNTP